MINRTIFSIIVPIYNVEKYLDKCVQSIINQTYSNIEVLLVDDGSLDKCSAMCDSYAEMDERIKVIHKENGGLSDARNIGLKNAVGDYIIFVDSDDYINQNTCEKLLPFAKMECDIIIGDGVCEGAFKKMFHGNTKECCSGKSYLKIAYSRGAMPLAAYLYIYRRKFLVDNELWFKKGITHEDVQFTPRAFLKADSVIETELCFYHYVIRENSITTQKNLKKNGKDLYETCLELRGIYDGLEDLELKSLMSDALVTNYLSLFQTGKLYQYGKEYIHKKFVFENAYLRRTKLKARLYCFNPRIYWHINYFVKCIGSKGR